MSTYDYAVLVALYMIVSLQGKNILKNFKLQRGSTTDALAHGVVFIGLLYLVGILSRRVATYNFNKRDYDEYCRPDENGELNPVPDKGEECYQDYREKKKESQAAAAVTSARRPRRGERKSSRKNVTNKMSVDTRGFN